VRRSLGVAAPFIVAMVLTYSLPARGDTKSAPLTASEQALESRPIFGGNSGTASTRSDSISTSAGTFDISRVVLALGGVLGLIVALRFGVKRFFPSAAVQRGVSSVKVLGKCVISARQNLLVVQFGKRLILVGDAGANLNPLCEITDPDEVAGILAQARDETISVARRFESLFGRARTEYGTEREPQSTEPFDDSNEIKPDDPALKDTQKELSDLRAKVRDVARQIGSA